MAHQNINASAKANRKESGCIIPAVGDYPKLLTAAAELFAELRYGHSERPFTVVECGLLADISVVINQVLKLPR